MYLCTSIDVFPNLKSLKDNSKIYYGILYGVTLINASSVEHCFFTVGLLLPVNCFFFLTLDYFFNS